MNKWEIHAPSIYNAMSIPTELSSRDRILTILSKVSKNGPVPGLRPLQNGISSHRDRFWTFSRREQKSQENRRYGLRYRLENSEI